MKFRILKILAFTAVILALFFSIKGHYFPSDGKIALDLEKRVVAALGVNPTSREYIEGLDTFVYKLEDTILLHWEGIDLGEQPGSLISEKLDSIGLEVLDTQEEVVDFDPRDKDQAWSKRILACDPRIEDAGVSGVIGTTANRELILILQVGGSPASVGCYTLHNN